VYFVKFFKSCFFVAYANLVLSICEYDMNRMNRQRKGHADRGTDRDDAWILEYREPASEKVCVWGVSYRSQALPALSPKKNSSKDPAAMEEACVKSTANSFEM
jgi:hypothetical protein